MFKYIWLSITKMFSNDNDYHVGDISKCPFMNTSAVPKESVEDQKLHEKHEG